MNFALCNYSGYNSSARCGIAKFAKVYALPCAEVEPPVADRDREACAYDGGLCVRRHVVVTFIRVKVIRLTLFHKPVEYGGKVCLHFRVCVFIYRQGGGSVFDEQI